MLYPGSGGERLSTSIVTMFVSCKNPALPQPAPAVSNLEGKVSKHLRSEKHPLLGATGSQEHPQLCGGTFS